MDNSTKSGVLNPQDWAELDERINQRAQSGAGLEASGTEDVRQEQMEAAQSGSTEAGKGPEGEGQKTPPVQAIQFQFVSPGAADFVPMGSASPLQLLAVAGWCKWMADLQLTAQAQEQARQAQEQEQQMLQKVMRPGGSPLIGITNPGKRGHRKL